MLRIPAIRIEQPLGVFFAVSLSAEFLLKVCYTIRAEFVEDDKDYNHEKPQGMFQTLSALSGGSQRKKDDRRIKEITRYTDTVDASFPNSIILGANYTEDGELLNDPSVDPESDTDSENNRIRWRIEKEDELYYLIIPTEERLASIIDGQHRLYAFNNSHNKDMQLLCSVYLDLPMPYHAQIFATINMNQKKVDKNHIYNLFQFQLEAGDSDTWSPETLAVYFTRVLSEDTNSPFNKKMKLGISEDNTTSISMASIVDGIMRLISSKPKEDREILHFKKIEDGRSRALLKESVTSAPLRKLYLSNKDKTIYNIILNYFEAVDSIFWKNTASDFVFKKTLGVHALFDFLKVVTKIKGTTFEYSKSFFISLLDPLANLEFSEEYYGVQTKLRTRLKNVLLSKSGIESESNIKNKYIIKRSENKDATMFVQEDGYKVVAGSKCNIDHHDSWNYSKLKDMLITTGILIERDDYLEFMEDFVFDSPSAAASIVLGKQAPGPLDWKDINGMSLKDKQL